MLLHPAVRTARVKASQPAAIKGVTVEMAAEETIEVVETRMENGATISRGGEAVPRLQPNSRLLARQIQRTNGITLAFTRFRMSNFKKTARLASLIRRRVLVSREKAEMEATMKVAVRITKEISFLASHRTIAHPPCSNRLTKQLMGNPTATLSSTHRGTTRRTRNSTTINSQDPSMQTSQRLQNKEVVYPYQKRPKSRFSINNSLICLIKGSLRKLN